MQHEDSRYYSKQRSLRQFAQQCGRRSLYVLGGKWKLPLILSLVQSPKRFNEIQKELTEISPKVLPNELKDLEENKFIKRNVHLTTPVTILYEATEYSQTLKNVLSELSAWGEQHRERIKQSMRE